MEITLPDIPPGSILGVNYSGMHDSAIAIVAPNGEIVFAVSLERLSRSKQDGRSPIALLRSFPWTCIEAVAISTKESFEWPTPPYSKVLSTELKAVRNSGLTHEKEFYEFLDALPCRKVFVCHQIAHAASAFWGSGFSEALCLTYDGGMHNSPWFGGIYKASRTQGIEALDQFSSLHYAKITTLYTFVTALLGFSPNKHEGKITGLAAYGESTQACRELLNNWFTKEYIKLESTMEWIFVHDATVPPALIVHPEKLQPFIEEASIFSSQEIAATIQEFAEEHVLGILKKVKEFDFKSKNICLAGGLFSNVKINQRVNELDFDNLFVAPQMTDDGTALGAAWHALSGGINFDPKPLHSVYLGPTFTSAQICDVLNEVGVKFIKISDPEEKISRLLADGFEVAIFQGAMEFGPRALGNRSILANATNSDVNISLNKKLNRTEFMPFAPVTRLEDANQYFLGIENIMHAAEFMTVTVACSKQMSADCPAVVHRDGTARPQIVSEKSNPLVHKILTKYIALTGKLALVNTSFNIHEEPIVCTPEDALQGFFESGLDYLYLEGGYIISSKENEHIALRYLRKKVSAPARNIRLLNAISQKKSNQLIELANELQEKERVIASLNDFKGYAQAQLASSQRTIAAYEMAYGPLSPFRFLAKVVIRGYSIIRPRLGNLRQYQPRPCIHLKGFKKNLLKYQLKFSIVTPSFQQGKYIQQTIHSVLRQDYPLMEYFVQDGGSKDETVGVLRCFESSLAGWESVTDEGQSSAINLAFEKTDGDIMSWINADDLLFPGVLSIVADYFQRHPEVDVVYGNRILIDANGLEIGRWILPGHDSEALSWVDYIPQETLFWRRQIWDRIGGHIDESFQFAMDWDLLLRFRDAGAKFAHIPRFLGAFRVHDDQKTSANLVSVGHHEMDLIRQRTIGYKPGIKEVRRATIYFLIRHVLVDLSYRLKYKLFGWQL